MIKREIYTNSCLSHPFLVKFYGVSLKKPFTIVMEFVKNGSLFDIIHSKKKSRVLDGTRKTLIAMGISNAMFYLHKKSIIHRDLKSTNILIDKEILPKICDFGISRFVTEDATMTACIGPPQWSAPEVMNGDDYSFPADVFSFGTILYELCTGLIPWGDLDVISIQKNVINGVRPNIPSSAPHSIKKLIKKCWNSDPYLRPTFEDIYELFRNGSCFFDDCDENEVYQLDKMLRKKQKKKENHKQKSKSVKEVSKSPKELEHLSVASENDNIDYAGSFVDIAAISNTRDYFFRSELKKAATSLQSVQSRSFFNVVEVYLKNNPRNPEMIAILETVKKVILKKCHLDTFIKMKLFEMLPYEKNELSDICFDILLIITQYKPSIIVNYLPKMVDNLAEEFSDKIIIILSNVVDYIQGSQLEEIVLSFSDIFIQSTMSAEYISLLFELCKDPNFRHQNIQQCLMIFNDCLQFDDPRAVNCSLLAMCNFSKKVKEIDYESICSHIINEETRSNSLELLIRIKELPIKKNLLRSLLIAAETHEEAKLCLLKMIAIEDSAKVLISANEWLNKNNPTIVGTLQLLLACMVHEQLRSSIKRMPNLAAFLSRLIDECDASVITYLSVIIEKLVPDKSFVSKLVENDVVGKIIATILEFEDEPPEMMYALKVLHLISQVTYCSDYLLVLERLKKIIWKGSELTPMAIAVITELSVYPQCAKRFIALKLPKYFKKLRSDPDYVPYANKFIANISVLE